MEGVTILSETLESASVTGGIIMIIFGIVSAVAAILLGIFAVTEDFPLIVVAVIISVFSIGSGIKELNKEPYTKYKVTIDKNVSLVEFNEKYEILDQDGLIYEVRERIEK